MMRNQSMMRILLTCLIVTQFAVLVQPLRFRDRFTGRRFPIPERCLIGFGEGFKRNINFDGMETEIEHFIRVYASMNCSMVYQEWTTVGKADSNGSFDGAIGFLQRNENDITMGFAPSDIFGVQPGFFVTAGVPTGAVIISKKNETKTQRLALLRLWANSFDAITADYILIVLFFFAAVLSFIVSQKRLDVNWWIVNFLSNSCSATIALIGHGSLDPIEESGRIAALFFNFFILFAIRSIMQSTLGSDLVYEIDPPIIESIDEFTNESYTQPAVIRQLYLLDSLQRAEPGSSVWRLYQVVQSHPNVTIWDLDLNGDMDRLQPQMQHFLHEMSDSRSALILNEVGYHWNKMVWCSVWTGTAKHLRSSRSFGSSAPGLMSMSYQIDPELRKVHEHMVSLARQSHYTSTFVDIFLRNLLTSLTATPAGVISDCEMGTAHKPHEYSNFKFEAFEPTFRGFAAALAFSLISFMIERNMTRSVLKLAMVTTQMTQSTTQAMSLITMLKLRRRRRVRHIKAWRS